MLRQSFGGEWNPNNGIFTREMMLPLMEYSFYSTSCERYITRTPDTFKLGRANFDPTPFVAAKLISVQRRLMSWPCDLEEDWSTSGTGSQLSALWYMGGAEQQLARLGKLRSSSLASRATTLYFSLQFTPHRSLISNSSSGSMFSILFQSLSLAKKTHRPWSMYVVWLPITCDLSSWVPDYGIRQYHATVTIESRISLVACFVSNVVPDTVGSSIVGVDTDALLATAGSEIETSIFAGNDFGAFTTIIKTSPVPPGCQRVAIYGMYIALRVKVESRVEIWAFTLATGAAPLSQVVVIRMSIDKFDQLQAQCRIGDVDSALGVVYVTGHKVLKFLSF